MPKVENRFIFNFSKDLLGIDIPMELNNPFDNTIPEIGRVATMEFQDFISEESQKWAYDFHSQKGKMFGVLVIQNNDNSYGYIGTVSGKLPNNIICDKLIPSVFDDSLEDCFINKGMTELTELSTQIKSSNTISEIELLKEHRSKKSKDLQRQLFESYQFLNLSGELKNVIEIFKISSHGYPPSAAGECTAPKLLNYALLNGLKPIAIAEFWWGDSLTNKDKVHKEFHPACKNRCRPILEYMLENSKLYEGRSL